MIDDRKIFSGCGYHAFDPDGRRVHHLDCVSCTNRAIRNLIDKLNEMFPDKPPKEIPFDKIMHLNSTFPDKPSKEVPFDKIMDLKKAEQQTTDSNLIRTIAVTESVSPETAKALLSIRQMEESLDVAAQSMQIGVVEDLPVTPEPPED